LLIRRQHVAIEAVDGIAGVAEIEKAHIRTARDVAAFAARRSSRLTSACSHADIQDSSALHVRLVTDAVPETIIAKPKSNQ
jgi:hypothetical protein